MVFGWSKKKQEDLEPQSQKSLTGQSIRIYEISAVLAHQKETEKKKILEQTKFLFEEMKRELDSIYSIISHLKNDDLKIDDIDKTLKVLVVRSKAEVIDVISKESQKSLPKISSYDDVVKTAELASHTLKKIGDVLGKNSRVIHVFAKKYAQDLKSHLELVTKNHVAITRMIAKISSIETSTALILEKATKITNTSQSIKDNITHLAKLKESHGDSEVVESMTQQQISNIFSSPAFAKFLQHQEKIKQAEAQEEKLNKEIDDEFSKISRPLGKYVYVTSLEKPLKLLLERLVERPSDTLLENKNSIVTILESCMKGILSGTVSVKETDKSVDQISHILSLLDGFISKKLEMKTRIEDLRKELGLFDIKQIETLEKQMAKAKFDKEDAKKKITTLESEIQRQEEQKSNLLAELENSLEQVLGTKHRVVLE